MRKSDGITSRSRLDPVHSHSLESIIIETPVVRARVESRLQELRKLNSQLEQMGSGILEIRGVLASGKHKSNIEWNRVKQRVKVSFFIFIIF